MEVTQQLLRQVQEDNIRIHQIGEIRDGISWDVAEDLGFMATDEVLELVPVIDAQQSEASTETETEPDTQRPLTSAEKNANYRRHLARHRKLVPKTRRGR